jgi:hypothetical protein
MTNCNKNDEKMCQKCYKKDKIETKNDKIETKNDKIGTKSDKIVPKLCQKCNKNDKNVPKMWRTPHFATMLPHFHPQLDVLDEQRPPGTRPVLENELSVSANPPKFTSNYIKYLIIIKSL